MRRSQVTATRPAALVVLLLLALGFAETCSAQRAEGTVKSKPGGRDDLIKPSKPKPMALPPPPPVAAPGLPLIELAARTEVVKELGLRPDQASALSTLRARHKTELNEGIARLAHAANGQPASQRFEQLALVFDGHRKRSDEALASLIGSEKMARLRQIQNQAGGLQAFLASPESSRVIFTAEQRSRYQAALGEIDREVEAFRRRRERESLESLLTVDQSKELAALLGPPVTFALPGLAPNLARSGPLPSPMPRPGAPPAESDSPDLRPIERGPGR